MLFLWHQRPWALWSCSPIIRMRSCLSLLSFLTCTCVLPGCELQRGAEGRKVKESEENTNDIVVVTLNICFYLFNVPTSFIRKIRPYLSECAIQLLEQAFVISCLDCSNVLLTGLPLCGIKPLQMIQNQIFNQPLFITLHWIPVTAYIRLTALTLA